MLFRSKVAKYILELLYGHAKSSNIKVEPCLYAGQMLTRIAYHLLGIIDQLPPALSRQAPTIQRPTRRLVKMADKEKKVPESSSSEEGEEIEVPQDFETSETIPEHMKKLYRQYESMKAHNEEMKDIAEFKTSLGYPTTRRKG